MVIGVENECTQGCCSFVAFAALVKKFELKATSWKKSRNIGKNILL
jgi:hypothetical protein